MATITLVPSLVARTGGSGANTFTTPGMTTTGASLLVAAVTVVSTASPPAVSDSKGNSWSALTAQTISGQQSAQLFYVANPTVGSAHTFTVTGTGIAGAIVVFAFTNIKTTTPADQQNGAKTSASPPVTLQPGSITPSNNGDLVVTACSVGTIGTVDIDNDAASIFAVAATLPIGGTSYGIFAAYGVQGTAAAVNPTWTASSGTDLAAVIASFTAATGSSGAGTTGSSFAG